MAIRLHEADLLGDGDALIELARANLGQTDGRRFQWLYRENPFGPARAWLAFDGTATPIGMCAVFPRRAYIAGDEVLGCVLGDFCVSQYTEVWGRRFICSGLAYPPLTRDSSLSATTFPVNR